jgi:hypothetical protein
MADKDFLTGIEQDVQIMERTKHAMESYFNWLQSATSAYPWSSVDLNKRFSSRHGKRYRDYVQKLSQAKSLQEIVKIQTEFMAKQLESFNEQIKAVAEICTAQDPTKPSA